MDPDLGERLENQHILIERLRSECAQLAAIVLELTVELEAELEDRYADRARYPLLRRRYERDMETINRARALLSEIEEKPVAG